MNIIQKESTNFNHKRDNMKDIEERLQKLSSKVEHLSSLSKRDCSKNKQDESKKLLKDIIQKLDNIQQNQNQTQLRFKSVEVGLPVLDKCQEKQKEKKILIWLGELCKKVFSTGFGLLKNGELDVNKVKSYCSQNIIRNLIRLSKRYEINSGLMKRINSCLQKQLLPYFCFKYPQTEEKQINKRFSSLLLQRDNINDNSNDLILRSGVRFVYDQDGNYNSQIMNFLNYIIHLPGSFPNKENSNNQFEDFTYFQSFSKDVENIFNQILVEEKKLNLLKFDPFKPQEMIQNIVLDKSEKQKQDYLQKVKSQTSYQIGQKLSQNFEQFSNYEIKTGNLRLKNSAIMRVVTKWCQQLEKNFDEKQILQRQIPFQLKNKTEKYFMKDQMNFLNILLQREKQIIKKKMQEISNHNYEQQSLFLKKNIMEDLEIFSEEEAIVGQFTGTMFKINENYLINYLNLLIHGIIKALRNYYFIRIKSNIIYKNNEIKALQYFLQNNKSTSINQQQYNKTVPELITFKIGDILRSKCTSKQTEIIALYKQIQKINYQNPKLLKILRVKNKLDTGNKDILMNLLYKDKIIVQIQLAIKTQKTKFIQCSNQFNHYFYQLKRAQFGPIMEMCSIWMSVDMRSNFYLDKIQENNTRNEEKQLKLSGSCCQKQINIQVIRFPFLCNSCKCYYFDCNFSEKHIFCKECKKFSCFLCQFQQGNNQYRKKLFAQFEQNPDKQYIFSQKPLKQLPQNYGVLINLKQKHRQMIDFDVVYENEYYHMFRINRDYKYQLVEKFKTRKLSKNFMKKYLIFNCNQSMNRYINPQHLKSYFISKSLNNYRKSFKNSVTLICKEIDNKIFSQYESDLPYVQKLNLSQNKLQNVNNVLKLFPNVTLAILSNNQIYKIQQSINYLQNLRYLSLQNNVVQNMDNLVQLKNLVELNLENNQLEHVPTTINLLSSLQDLNLSKNFIKQLPKQFGKLSSLQSLNLYDNYLSQLPEQFFTLNSLTKLNISGNYLTKLPQEFGMLSNLKKLQLHFNEKLNILPQSFNRLNLEVLNISDFVNFRKIYSTKYSLNSLTKVTIYTVDKNQYQKMEENYPSRSNLIISFTLMMRHGDGTYIFLQTRRQRVSQTINQKDKLIQSGRIETIIKNTTLPGAVGMKQRVIVEQAPVTIYRIPMI